MSKLKEIVDVIKRNNFGPDETKEFLAKINQLSREDKNLIYLYLFPRTLLDRELPNRIQAYKEKKMTADFSLDKTEAALLIEAYRTPQYHRFMLHLYHSFGNKMPDCNSELKIYPLDYNVDEDECPICGKKVVGINELDKAFNNENFIAYTTKTTSVSLCKDCVIQLLYSGQLLEEIEPGYLHTP